METGEMYLIHTSGAILTIVQQITSTLPADMKIESLTAIAARNQSGRYALIKVVRVQDASSPAVVVVDVP